MSALWGARAVSIRKWVGTSEPRQGAGGAVQEPKAQGGFPAQRVGSRLLSESESGSPSGVGELGLAERSHQGSVSECGLEKEKRRREKSKTPEGRVSRS